MSKLSEEEARDKVFNDYLDNIRRSVRKARLFYKTTVAQLEAELDGYKAGAEVENTLIGLLEDKVAQLTRLDVEILTTDEEGNPVGCGMDLLDWQAHLQTELGLARLEIRELEAKLLAHTKNEGDECLLCVLEEENAELRRILGPALVTVIKVKELGDALKVKHKKEDKNV